MRKPAKRLPIEEKVRVVLAVLGGEMTASEAARRQGVSVQAVLTWRDKFLDAGRRPSMTRSPGPGKSAGSAEERQLKLENNQLKLALAEAAVPLRIWQKGAEYAEAVPSQTSRPRARQRVCRSRGSPAWRAFRGAATAAGSLGCATASRAGRRQGRGGVGEVCRGVAGVGASQDRRADARGWPPHPTHRLPQRALIAEERDIGSHPRPEGFYDQVRSANVSSPGRHTANSVVCHIGS